MRPLPTVLVEITGLISLGNITAEVAAQAVNHVGVLSNDQAM